MATNTDLLQQLTLVTKTLNDAANDAEKLQNNMLEKQIENMKMLGNLRFEQLNKEKSMVEDLQYETMKALIERGRADTAEIQARLAPLLEVEEDYLKAKTAKDKKAAIAAKKDRLKSLKSEDKEAYKIWKATEDKKQKENDANRKRALKDITASGKSFQERLASFKEAAFTDANGNEITSKGGKIAGVLNSLGTLISDYAAMLDKTIDDVAGYKRSIDTRLQGSKNETESGLQGDSYWDKMSQDLVGVAGVSPLVKQSDIAKNIQSMVDSGIAFNVEQRAFLSTIKDSIATTFDATDGTLLRLVRIQQQDSTAARLGMESAINSFLNNMYENTEYLSKLSASVRSALNEAEALMGTAEATAFEYQVQKWMGSLYSVGMSDSAVQNIATTLGQLAAGDISALSGDGTGNLLVMAANNANLSLADILADGLNESNTNKLLEATVNYLSKLYSESKDSKVVQQQIAKVYGVAASDLKAVANLSGNTGSITNSYVNYNTAMRQLNTMASTMYSRTSVGQMMSNAFDNLNYSMASGIASNPALYAVYKMAGLLDSVAGGISIPDVMAMGTGVSLNTTIADMMRVGALGGSIISGIGSLISTGGNGGLSGSGMLRAAGISNGLVTNSFGTGSILAPGSTTSQSAVYVANGSSSDIQNKTLSDANDQKAAAVSAAEEESDETKLSTVDEHVVEIYKLLESVTTGMNSFTVKYEA